MSLSATSLAREVNASTIMQACNECQIMLSLTSQHHVADANHSLCVQKSDKGIVITTIYVDDLIVGGDSMDEIEHIKGLLKKQFDMKDLGDLHYFLGIEVIRMHEGIWLS